MAFGLFRGLPNLGGPIVTASGLVFIAAANDDKLRAFDVLTGRELWRASLPAGGQATPMTYVAGGRQFVVIAAGGACADGHQIRRRGRRVRAPGSRRRKLTRLDGPGLAQHACFRDTRDHEEE